MSNYTDPVTVSGSVVNFSAPSGGIIDSLILSVSPTQDLHGYSNPWPAGGGKNLCSMQNESFTRTKDVEIDEIPAGSYTYSAVVTSTDTDASVCVIAFLGANSTVLVAKSVQRSTGGSRVSTSFTVSAPIKYIRMYASSSWPASQGDTATFADNMIESGSTPTSYTPYSNICPISGRTGLSVYVSPTQNQADATTYSSDWTSVAGTVYGGSLDVVTGVLTVDMATVDLGSLHWVAQAAGNFMYSTGIASYVKAPSSNDTVANILCSTAESVSANAVDTTSGALIGIVNNGNIRFRYDGFSTTPAQFETDVSGMQLVYELDTPVTYQLTPQQISVLVGENYVWNDSSNTTLTYRLLIVDWHKGATSIGKNTASLIVSQQFGAYSKVVINVTSELYYESGNDTGRTLTIDCPWGTQAMADNILASLEGYQYQPYEAESAILDPAAELGDGLTVNGVYGGIFKLTIRSGALHAVDVSSPQDEEIDHEYQFTPASERKIERRLANMQSELSVQADQIAAKVDENGGDSSFGWSLTSNGFTLESNGSNVMTVDSTGLTVNGNGTFTGTVQAKNIAYGGSNGTFSGGGISGGSITIGKCSSGINSSLGNADYSADVFSGAAVATFTKAKNLYCVGRFLYNGTEFTPAVYYLLDQNSNVVRIRCLQS